MRPIVSFITVAAFVLHMWLGCCAHHAHATEETTCHQFVAKLADPSHAGHGHDNESPCDKSQEDSPSPAEGCTGSYCVFLTIAKTELAKLAMVAVLPVPAIDVIAILDVSSSANLVDTEEPIPYPVRLHLLNRVLLI